SRTTPALFLTRWVTHFCAPVFVFLAGTGAFLARRNRTTPQLSWFLLTRGLWVVILEFTLVHLGWAFSFDYSALLAQVIWALGLSMVALAGLVVLPTWAITALGVAIVVGHNGLDGLTAEKAGLPNWLWGTCFRFGILEPWPGTQLYVAYPVLPWL